MQNADSWGFSDPNVVRDIIKRFLQCPSRDPFITGVAMGRPFLR